MMAHIAGCARRDQCTGVHLDEAILADDEGQPISVGTCLGASGDRGRLETNFHTA